VANAIGREIDNGKLQGPELITLINVHRSDSDDSTDFPDIVNRQVFNLIARYHNSRTATTPWLLVGASFVNGT
jgi:hypothetical protein